MCSEVSDTIVECFRSVTDVLEAARSFYTHQCRDFPQDLGLQTRVDNHGFPLFFQNLDFVMARRRIVRLSEVLNPLQIFLKSSMVAHRLVENYWNRF